MRRTALLFTAITVLLIAPGCLPAPTGPATLIIGDSNTIGTAWGRPASWAEQLSCSPDVWAWGGTGITRAGYTGGGPITLTADLDTIMNGRTGDHVAVMLGTNDALGRTSLPTVAQLNTLTDRIIATGAASVRWITIPPLRADVSATTRARRDTLNTRITQTANHLDSSGAFGGAATLPPNMAADSLHLNQNGHATLGYHMAVNTNLCG